MDYQALFRLAYRFARSLGERHDDAKDLAADTVERLLKTKFRGEARLSTFVWKVFWRARAEW